MTKTIERTKSRLRYGAASTQDPHIGTSGWMYKDWGATFYPKDMKKGFLSFLAQEFNTVEINSSFYHLPRPSTFAAWRQQTPEQFAFAVKMSRFITHNQKLRHCRIPIERFLSAARELSEKLSIVLIQLPPSLSYDKRTLTDFLRDLSTAQKKLHLTAHFALEPRHQSWIEEKNTAEIRAILRKNHMGLVFAHSANIPSVPPADENILADFIYLRFHGPTTFAGSPYGRVKLRPWAQHIARWHARGLPIYVYFNNDKHGHAITDARTLRELLRHNAP